MIKLLDCTLRDGGYINNWDFGENCVLDTIEKIEKTDVDILEVGFLKDEPYDRNRTVFNDVKQISTLIPNKKKNIEYAAMIEVVNPIPLEKIDYHKDDGIDIIRVIVWKTKRNEYGKVVDALEEGFAYCKGIVEKGYKLCVQPARVDQYSKEEFVEMLNKFQQLKPMAIYVVDSWGTQDEKSIMEYVELANNVLNDDIAIGYHGHNNLMQAYGTATKFVNEMKHRNLIVDASIYGIGRGAGNLNLELFAKYLNEREGKNYNISPMIYVYEKYLKDIYDKTPWGYSLAFYLTAMYGCNPNYASYMFNNINMPLDIIEKVLKALNEEDKIIYSKEKADRYIENILKKEN